MPSPTRILLIGDDAQARGGVAAALAASNLTLTLAEAADARAGLVAATSQDFHCVLLDSRLAGVALPDYLAQLTSAQGGRQAVIALTRAANPDEALALLRAGAVDSLDLGEADAKTLARAVRYAKARRGFVAELEAARDEAQAKAEMIDRLARQTTVILSIVAHDLRNPFQVLLAMSEMLILAAKSADPEAVVRRASVVNEAATQAHELLESLFSWANLHMDARVEPKRLDVSALFEDCMRAMKSRAEVKSVRLEALPTDVFALAQEDATAAILRNLVGNALKFTEAGGGVTLAAERRGDGRVALCVIDTGVGMSEAQAAKLFQGEKRSTSAGTSGERGAGLGLLLCRDLAQWVGGELEVESQLGVGTTFRLVLKAADETAA